MKRRARPRPPRAILSLLVVASVAPAHAQVGTAAFDLNLSGAVTAASDYIFRGLSLTGGRPALQGALEVDHSSGLYLGIFTSNDHFGTARVEVDPSAGYRFGWRGATFDLGLDFYTYPGAGAQPFGYNYAELAAQISYDIGIATARWNNYCAPSNQFRSGPAYYTEFGVDLRLPHDVTLSGRIGYQAYDNHVRIGLPDYLNWSVAFSHDLPFGLQAAAGYYQTNIGASRCGDQKVCGAAAVATITYRF
jgi:uncharacterized protein (TIGR02001 family)